MWYKRNGVQELHAISFIVYYILKSTFVVGNFTVNGAVQSL